MNKDNNYILQNLVADTSSLIPTKNGTQSSIYFDNAGTTPPFNSVLSEIKKYTPWYKYVSDKSAKAAFLSDLYEEGRVSIKRFVHADMDNDSAVYTKNTTEAINIVSNIICAQSGGARPVVITTYMEHMSNYLPWKYRCNTVLSNVLPNGRLSMADLKNKLMMYQGRVKLVAVTGAANVTGYVNPIGQIARLAHRYGAQILVDAAQLVQHRTIDMHPPQDEERIDFLAFSAHKAYAPFFTGVLVGSKQVLNNGYPLCFGAGITEFVSASTVRLKPSPQRFEAGSNNILGAIALATAIQTMTSTGMDTIQAHESTLLSYATEKLKQNPNVILYGDTQYLGDRVPIIAFNVRGKGHHEVAKYLYESYGIIAKNGYCGADLYVKKLTQGSAYTGIVRISMALYNQTSEIDRLIQALRGYE